MSLSIRKVKLRNFVLLYEAYFEALREEKRNWSLVQLETPQPSPKLTLQRAVMIHLIQKLFARSHAVARTGSVHALFDKMWNPLVLEILAENKLVGCAFVARQSVNVFQINVVSSVKPKQKEWVLADVFLTLKQYLRKFGATRIITRSSEEETKRVLRACGFEGVFYDNVLYLDVTNDDLPSGKQPYGH